MNDRCRVWGHRVTVLAVFIIAWSALLLRAAWGSARLRVRAGQTRAGRGVCERRHPCVHTRVQSLIPG